MIFQAFDHRFEISIGSDSGSAKRIAARDTDKSFHPTISKDGRDLDWVEENDDEDDEDDELMSIIAALLLDDQSPSLSISEFHKERLLLLRIGSLVSTKSDLALRCGSVASLGGMLFTFAQSALNLFSLFSYL